MSSHDERLALNAAYTVLEDAGLKTELNLRLVHLAASQGKSPEESARRIVERDKQ
jgi:hypothetical protein